MTYAPYLTRVAAMARRAREELGPPELNPDGTPVDDPAESKGRQVDAAAVLALWEGGMTYAEITERLGCALSTVSRAVRQAKAARVREQANGPQAAT